MMLALVLILLGLSTWQASETISEGEIFEPLRRLGGHFDNHPSLWVRVVTLPLRASSCSFCISHWVALFLTPFALVAVYGEGTAYLVALSLFLWLSGVSCSSLLRLLPGNKTDTLKSAATEDIEAELLERLGDGYEIHAKGE